MIIGIVFLCLNYLKFLLGIVPILMGKTIAGLSKPATWPLRIWNTIECLGMGIALIILIINYF